MGSKPLVAKKILLLRTLLHYFTLYTSHQSTYHLLTWMLPVIKLFLVATLTCKVSTELRYEFWVSTWVIFVICKQWLKIQQVCAWCITNKLIHTTVQDKFKHKIIFDFNIWLFVTHSHIILPIKKWFHHSYCSCDFPQDYF